jgi:hypothetical protein
LAGEFGFHGWHRGSGLLACAPPITR